MAENKKFSPTVYSQIGFGNPNGTVEQSSLSIQYWNNLMKLQVGLKVDTDNNQYRYEPGDAIYLTYSKAFMLSMAIDKVISGEARSSGVMTENMKSYAGVCKTDDGKYLLSIISLNEDKVIQSTSVYEFKSDYYTLINNVSVKSNQMSYDTETIADLELRALQVNLNQFVNSMSYVSGYEFAVTSQRDTRFNKLFGIANKLGVSDYGNANRGQGRSNAEDIFNSSASLVDLDDELPFE